MVTHSIAMVSEIRCMELADHADGRVYGQVHHLLTHSQQYAPYPGGSNGQPVSPFVFFNAASEPILVFAIHQKVCRRLETSGSMEE